MLSARLSNLRDEAERLAQACDGTHDMRAAVSLVRGFVSLAEQGEEIGDDVVERLVAKMRICQRTHQFPKADISPEA